MWRPCSLLTYATIIIFVYDDTAGVLESAFTHTLQLNTVGFPVLLVKLNRLNCISTEDISLYFTLILTVESGKLRGSLASFVVNF